MIKDIVEENKEKYKCFVCNSRENTCDTYHALKGYENCIYQLVAKNDLDKWKRNDPYVTLKDQLLEYVKVMKLIK